MTKNTSKAKKLKMKELFMIIEKEISNDLEFAKRLLKLVDRKKYSTEYNYLIGMIMEEETYSNYDDKTREKYDKYLELGRTALKEEDYSKAYNYFSTGYDVTKNNVFCYYMGKALYKGDSKRASHPYFEKYTRFGGYKVPKALLYLMTSYSYIGNCEKVRKYYGELSQISSSFSHNFKLVSPFNKDGELKAKYLSYMTEEDFKDKASKLDISCYYDYNTDEKLLLIESLFQKGSYNLAIKLFRELKPITKRQKKKVQSIEKNKTLYKNKRSN